MVRTKNHVLIISAVAVIGSLLYFYFDPSYHHFFPPCPFFTLTGFFCPGCGSQRALHDLLHGNITQAASHNILFILFIPFILYAAWVAAYNIFSSKKIGQEIFSSAVFARIVLVAVLLFWGLRNIPVLPFSWLAP